MPKKILIVDDEEVIVEIAKRKLEEKGYEVLTAFNGEEALVAVAKQKPDLIFMDVQMPKMTGYTCLVEMRKTPGLADVPVIIISAYGEMEAILRRHRIKDYLLKPLKLQDLMSKADEILQGP